MKVLFDTCIVMDYLEDRKPFAEDALKVLSLAADDRISAFITAKSMTDICYLIHRCGYHKTEYRGIMVSLYDFFDVLDTSQSDTFNALFLDIEDYEDAVMVTTALSNSIDCIITRNKKDFVNSPVKVYSPSEFL